MIREETGLFGLLWYLIGLLPVIGLVQVGPQLMADRYTYLTSVGIFIWAVWGVAEFLKNRDLVLLASCSVGALLFLTVCVTLTSRQVTYWRDTVTLFTHSSTVTSKNAIAYRNLGMALSAAGRDEEAVRQFRNALRITPNFVWALYGIGHVLAREGDTMGAISFYRAATRNHLEDPQVFWEFGLLLSSSGALEEAARQFFEVLRLSPGFDPARRELAIVMIEMGRSDLAKIQYARLLRLSPNETHLQPLPAIATMNKSAIVNQHTAQQDQTEAAQCCSEARTFEADGDFKSAISDYRQALSLLPGTPDLQRELAWLLATCPMDSLRNGGEAVSLAERAFASAESPDVRFVATLEVSYAEMGRFQDAINLAESSIGTRGITSRSIVERLECYRVKKPFHCRIYSSR